MTNKHFKFSMAKSILRLGGCYGLWTTGDMLFMYIGVFFGLAEILGILEEFEQVDRLPIYVKINNKERRKLK